MRYILTLIFLTNALVALTQVSSNAYPPMTKPIQLTSNFAEYRKNHFHSGIDVSVRNRTNMNVFSIWDGYVSRVRYNSASYGRAVYITHPNGYSSVYGHLDSFAPFIDSLVLEYQYANKVFETDIQIPAGTVTVKKGQVLGIAGNSGFSFGAHLHFEIRDAATDDPVNPLKFIPVDDLMEPQFRQLSIYRMQPGGFLPAKATYYKTIKKGNIFTTATEIIVPDTFFLGFDVQDFQSFSYYRLLPQIIEVLIDDVPIWSINFDRFSFDQSGACRGVFDHYAGLNSNKQIVTTYTGNHLRQRFFKQYSNDGLIILTDTLRHKLTVKATDTEFNPSVFSTTIRKGNIVAPSVGKHVICTKYFHEFSTEHLTVKCDTGTFYSDLALDEPLLAEFGTGADVYWKIGYNEIPLIKPIHVSFAPKEEKNEKILLAKVSGKNIDKVWKPAMNEDGKMTADIDRSGIFRLMTDTIPPVISKTNIPATSKLTWQKEISLQVTDNSTDIDQFNAYINGEWTLMTYDLKSDTFTIPLSTAKKTTLKILRVDFTDLAGNKTEKEYRLMQ
ncbi:MAG: hypothetical protein A2W93_06220 [Bacteroidetes bacterium GWF2_43_63]|nr:MAG: hypothetical protein A2W94_08315 [Bacteroidetes bacterium GWE2_42_42]OFY53216.1 MAG: hypothetical protein A2W93_06220 [Bacteroidetes bacterium GWF2_43_63]HBG71792.1 hypothetical protein [Bacteroidales bacterium]HCB61543.1 hypothetical protein [Bacteroidales bacterium]HCY22755.1 hypothetical protein [Bacteroidales bacterium]